MKLRTTKFGLAAFSAVLVGLVAAPRMVSAGPILFDTTLTGIQQNDNRPCVISEPSCNKPAGWNHFTETAGNVGGGETYNLYSPTYLVVAGDGIVNVAGEDQIPQNLTILVDENIAAGASGPETLVAFRTYDCTAAVADGGNISAGGTGSVGIPAGCSLIAANSYQPGSPTIIPNANNGNGYSDFGLTGFNLILGHHYLFQAVVGNDTDGMEQFFILPLGGPGTVPEPASMLLLGTGLVGVAGAVRRRLQKKS